MTETTAAGMLADEDITDYERETREIMGTAPDLASVRAHRELMEAIETATTITPAARRIARETNSTPRALATRFDIDGQVLDRHPADMWYLPGNAPVGMAITTIGCAGVGHMTYRTAQDSIDAYNAYPDDADDRAFYLQQLETRRSFERFGEYR